MLSLSRLRTEMRARHYPLRTEQAYVHWVRRFVTFHCQKSPRELGHEAAKEYLEFPAEERQAAASTQNQALNALVFLYKQVWGAPLGTIGDFTRAKRPRHLPVVLTREEVNGLLEALPSAHFLMAGLLYGGISDEKPGGRRRQSTNGWPSSGLGGRPETRLNSGHWVRLSHDSTSPWIKARQVGVRYGRGEKILIRLG